jgi:hypothetical protein
LLGEAGEGAVMMKDVWKRSEEMAAGIRRVGKLGRSVLRPFESWITGGAQGI